MIEISVVIPCYNAATTLPALLGSLAAQTLPKERWEVILIDDGSTDGSAELARGFSFVTVLQQQQGGPGAARNLGTRHARGGLILYLDADLTTHPELVAAHLAFHQAHPEIAATGGSVLPGLPLPPFSWVLADHLCSWFNAHPRAGHKAPPEYLPSLNFCVKRAWLQGEDPWEAGAAHTGEDVVFCYGLRQRGGVLAFVADATVYHHDRADLRAYLRHMYRWGHHAPHVRGRLPGLRYGFLFPPQPWRQWLMLPAIVGGYTALVWVSWLSARPLMATLSLPQILLGRLAYAAGVVRGSRERARGG